MHSETRLRALEQRTYSAGGTSYEQAREEAGRPGRATATRPAVAAEAGWQPAGPELAFEPGRSARAQDDHVADPARTGPLTLRPSKRNGAPSRWWGAVLFMERGEPLRFIVD